MAAAPAGSARRWAAVLGTRAATHIVSWAAPECIVIAGSPVAAPPADQITTQKLF